MDIDRRSFLRTVSAAGAGLALAACGGGSGSGSSAAPAPGAAIPTGPLTGTATLTTWGAAQEIAAFKKLRTSRPRAAPT